ncbi:translation initiation factor IF-2 subunit beta [Candidatus Micrarchaeota archaeon]|nr:translation initiation factor IF-2 subunit beta [Candidatus Micrarchaeota archaeon]
MQSYEALLDKLYKELPKKEISGERFQVPELRISQEGNKTIIHNFDVVLNKLRRDPQLLSKFLSKELAVPTTIDGPRLILHAKILRRLIEDKLNKFVKKYVICSVCGKPDTVIKEFHGVKMLICEACGARTPIK